ncbi:uncharacterized protein [Choristoneura fumiferana]|uniref:uncharacterized protein n=1 Tax=Choristoneura fumiferana TaxID=7141 RepID=UPI003D1542D0
MASLARSLLALTVVALLQTACADLPSCTTADFGSSMDHIDSHIIAYELAPIRLTHAYNDVHIDDPFKNKDIKLLGEKIVACNLISDRAPSVSQISPGSLDDINVSLGFCVPPPVDIEVRVTRYAIIQRE